MQLLRKQNKQRFNHMKTLTEIKDKLAKWYDAANSLTVLKAKENTLRQEVFTDAFVDPKEGTNNLSLQDGHKLVATYPFNRKVDAAAFQQLTPQLREMGVDTVSLVKWVPELVKSSYNKLNEEQKKLMDECITCKPGMPGLAVKKDPKYKAPVGE